MDEGTPGLTEAEIRLTGEVQALKALLVQVLVIVATGQDLADAVPGLKENLSHLEIDPEVMKRSAGWGDASRQVAESQAARTAAAVLDAVQQTLDLYRRKGLWGA